MKIWGDVPKVLGVYDKQKNISKIDKTSTVASKKDVVSISNRAKDFQTVMKAIRDVPDLRQDKVNELMERYQSGNYDVDGSDVVEKVIKSIVDTKV